LWLILLTTVIAALAAYFFSSRQTPIYRASTRLLVSQSLASNSSMQYADILAAERLSSTYAEMLTSRRVMRAAIAKTGMKGIVRLDELADTISVQPVRDTQLIDLFVEYPNPDIATDLANALPEVFVEFNNQQQTARYQELKTSLQQQLQELSQEIQDTDAKLQELTDATDAKSKARQAALEDRLAQYRSTFGNVLAQLENIRLAEANAQDTITVVDVAERPQYPVRPRVLMNVFLAALIGGMIGLGAAFLIEYMDDSIKSVDDISRITPLSTLGIIARDKDKQDGIITIDDPQSPVAEAYRTLRTGIQFAGVDHPIRSLVITSAGPSEGKTTTAANLAAVMAQAGKKVVLIDADLRKPAQHKIWRASNTVGLTGALLMDEISDNLDYLLTPTQLENLWLLTSGQLPHNPSELLGSHKLKQLTEQLLQSHDFLIFDSPPALAVTDPVILSREMDGIIIVVDAGTTREPSLIHVLSEMEKVKANVLGIVLNRYRHQSAFGYYYYSRYYRNNEENSSDDERYYNQRESKNIYKWHRNNWLARQFSRLVR
jgi:non-specific protein-tyrosine kinase